MPYDPEGALGAVTSAFLTFLGLQAGKIIVNHADHIERERRLISWGLILVTHSCYRTFGEAWKTISKIRTFVSAECFILIKHDCECFKARVGVFYQDYKCFKWLKKRLILYEFIGEVIFKINFV